ncbi:ABC transporter permease [Bullifex porci]|uniref:ABC transporter permease n=1 Tax=Bullifex porci TaxID=2606638 RepID=A0A7X2PDD3_9SPIO|nr:ABC transporter permease [Bullifex porci]MDD7254970.1 ABC transporter permease [Bullifex porci]MDD7588013.1 ABC transporter permease [Bullifex porci]MDY2741655.1 ABC transporter permease [Bullifex porci]MSU06778.1 ABC transporter permease [Bullifex porci]
MKKTNIKSFVLDNLVPIIFIVIGIFGIMFSGFSATAIANEMMTRLARNSFLVISLLIPIMAGMGLNFGMTLGAMAGQIGLIFITEWGIVGIPGMILAAIISTPISIFLGYICGKILNMAKGREMVTSYIIGFFINGVYQLIVLFLMGVIIPIKSDILLPRGYGIRNTVNLIGIRKCLDNLIPLKIAGVSIPLATFLVIALLCLFIIWFRKTKLGQDMRAVSQDMEVARDSGIKVEETRILSIIISTVLAGYGMIIYLQNMGTLNTYNSHNQIGMFSAAALLVGGASVSKANIRNVFLGVILFHLMFYVSPYAGKNLIGEAQLGEYFRVFVSYGVITLSLVLYELKKKRDKLERGKKLALMQEEDK